MDALKRILMLKTLKKLFKLTQDEMKDIVEIGDHTLVVVKNNKYTYVSIEDLENVIDGSLDYEDLERKINMTSIVVTYKDDSEYPYDICTDTLST